jgi:hypothetical protein
VDETADKCGRYIANLLIGVLNEETPTKELGKTNHKTIVRFVQDRLSRFFLTKYCTNQKNGVDDFGCCFIHGQGW